MTTSIQARPVEQWASRARRHIEQTEGFSPAQRAEEARRIFRAFLDDQPPF